MGDSFQRVNVDEQATRVLYIRRPEDLANSVAAELAEWARFKPAGESSRVVLDALLSFDGLITAATSGVIGGAAWSIFPAAARWLKERSAKKPATATEILSCVKSSLEDMEPGVSRSLKVNDMNRNHDGSWRLTLHSGKRVYRVAVDLAGDLVALEAQATPRRGHG